jgi:hypothetical protein
VSNFGAARSLRIGIGIGVAIIGKKSETVGEDGMELGGVAKGVKRGDRGVVKSTCR